MFKKDYLQRQIDQAGLVLAKLLTDLLSLNDQLTDPIVYTEEQLVEQLDVQFYDVLKSDRQSFELFLKQKSFNRDYHWQSLAHILFELSKKEVVDDEKKRQLLEKSLWLYEKLSKESTTYSLEWPLIIDEIKAKLEG